MANSDDDFHYVVIRCACGFEPDDAEGDNEACQLVLRHIAAYHDMGER